MDGSSTGTRVPSMRVLLGHPPIRRSQIMRTITTIGLDIAKSVFQVHGVDVAGAPRQGGARLGYRVGIVQITPTRRKLQASAFYLGRSGGFFAR